MLETNHTLRSGSNSTHQLSPFNTSESKQFPYVFWKHINVIADLFSICPHFHRRHVSYFYAENHTA